MSQPTDSPQPENTLSICINGTSATVPQGTTAAVAIINQGTSHFLRSVGGERRMPLCGMGVCHECRITINGETHQRGCLRVCTEGMEIITHD